MLVKYRSKSYESMCINKKDRIIRLRSFVPVDGWTHKKLINGSDLYYKDVNVNELDTELK